MPKFHVNGEQIDVRGPADTPPLDLAASKAGWGSAPLQGRGRGIAVHESFGSVCAQVAVHLVADGDKPTGVGEPGVPAVASAIANALFALTGKRVRALPLSGTKWA